MFSCLLYHSFYHLGCQRYLCSLACYNVLMKKVPNSEDKKIIARCLPKANVVLVLGILCAVYTLFLLCFFPYQCVSRWKSELVGNCGVGVFIAIPIYFSAALPVMIINKYISKAILLDLSKLSAGSASADSVMKRRRIGVWLSYTPILLPIIGGVSFILQYI